MRNTQYSLTADSTRWWWPSATLGTVALAAALAVPVIAGHASPVDRVPASDDGYPSSRFEVTGAALAWPCSMRRAIRNDGAHGPQPVCGTSQAEPRTERAVDCPPPPDVRYVGVPWVPYEPTGCRSLDRWWTAVDR